MDADTSFRVNEPGVISEVIEGEAIVLNFASGTYYSMNHSLQLLWDGVNRGLTRAQVEALLAARYPDAGDELAQHVAAALNQLVAEELLVAAPTGDAATIRQAAGECLKRVPLEKKLRLLGVRVGALSRKDELALTAQALQAELPFGG